MKPETEYDPVSGVEVEICRTCEELTKNFRSQVAYLRRFDDLANQVPDYWGLRSYLISGSGFRFRGVGQTSTTALKGASRLASCDRVPYQSFFCLGGGTIIPSQTEAACGACGILLISRRDKCVH